MYRRVLNQFLMPYSYLDSIELAKIIRNSELMWTMVRLAILRNVSALRKLNVGLYGSLMYSIIISREDVAILCMIKFQIRNL